MYCTASPGEETAAVVVLCVSGALSCKSGGGRRSGCGKKEAWASSPSEERRRHCIKWLVPERGEAKEKGPAEAETAAWMDAVVWKEEEEAEKGQYCASVGCSRVRRAVSTLVSSQRERRAMEKRYTIQTSAATKK